MILSRNMKRFLLSIASPSSTRLARGERGVHAASTGELEGNRKFSVQHYNGRRSGLKPALRHAIARDSIILILILSLFGLRLPALAAAPRPNVVFIIIDNVDYGYMGKC